MSLIHRKVAHCLFSLWNDALNISQKLVITKSSIAAESVLMKLNITTLWVSHTDVNEKLQSVYGAEKMSMFDAIRMWHCGIKSCCNTWYAKTFKLDQCSWSTGAALLTIVAHTRDYATRDVTKSVVYVYFHISVNNCAIRFLSAHWNAS